MSDQPYKMPPICGGCPALFYEGGDRNSKPKFAFVSKVGEYNVLLHVLSEESHNFLIRDGVTHIDNPRLKTNPHARESGAWDYHPMHVDLIELQAKVTELYAKIEELLTKP